MKSKMLFLAAGLLLLLLWTVAATAITVTVNGQALPDGPPAVQRSGRVLLPMRTVFESLGATVQWQAATRPRPRCAETKPCKWPWESEPRT